MKKLLIILFVVCFTSAFSQTQNFNYTHWGNYNPPDDPAVDTGWLTTGFFIYLHGHGGGIIASAFGIGAYYDTRKFMSDIEGRTKEHRRIIHKRHHGKI